MRESGRAEPYAGRWYHLAATMTSGGSWTNLSVYANGALIPGGWTNGSAFTAKDSTTAVLRVGYDSVANAYFAGTIDEFRLYKTALTGDGVRGLMWFLEGANNVIIPRGVFFSSKLFGALNGSFDPASPLNGATVHANDDNLSAHLNGRVIQLVIDANLTLDRAWRILDLTQGRLNTCVDINTP